MSKFRKHREYTDWFDTEAYRMAAGIVASASPLGIISMGTFPSSLVALGRLSRRHFDDPHAPQRKENTTDKELELPR